MPSMQYVFGNKPAIFQQDNAPCDTAKAVKEWIDANNIQVLSWPGNSPDLNQIENIWDHLARQIAKEKFQHGKELLEKLKVTWQEIPLPCLERLIGVNRHLNKLICRTGFV